MPAISWGAPARPRCDRPFVTPLALLLVLLLALGLTRDARSGWERAAWHLRAWYAVHSLPGPGQEAGHFRVWLLGVEAGHSRQLAQLEAAYNRVTADLGVEPPGPVPLVLHGERSTLEEYAGRAAGTASGVYAAGVVHLLWQEDLRGPLAHELTHYLLDLVAPGRVPRWFQEGLAQLEEYRVTGKVLYDPTLAPRVPSVRLDREFDRLPDQVAYGASLSLVLLLYHEGGDGVLRRVVGALSEGVPFARAVRLCWGRSLAELDAQRVDGSVGVK